MLYKYKASGTSPVLLGGGCYYPHLSSLGLYVCLYTLQICPELTSTHVVLSVYSYPSVVFYMYFVSHEPSVHETIAIMLRRLISASLQHTPIEQYNEQ